MTAEAAERQAAHLFPVPFYVGDGSGKIMLYVSYIAEFPRDGDHQCAFCHGDPCAERSGPEAEISRCLERWKARIAEYEQRSPGSFIAKGLREEGFTCPLCKGRPS